MTTIHSCYYYKGIAGILSFTLKLRAQAKEPVTYTPPVSVHLLPALLLLPFTTVEEPPSYWLGHPQIQQLAPPNNFLMLRGQRIKNVHPSQFRY